MPEEERKIILYHARWCHHCVKMIEGKDSTWSQVKKRIDKLRKTNKMISYEEYEADANPAEIEKANITGFPTIKMQFGDKVVEYGGDRTTDAIMDALLTTKMPDQQAVDDQDAQQYGQCGGAKRSTKQPKSKRLSENQYKIKYAKYKAKYFKLLSSINF